MITRRKISFAHIRSLGFHDIIEGVTLRRLRYGTSLSDVEHIIICTILDFGHVKWIVYGVKLMINVMHTSS